MIKYHNNKTKLNNLKFLTYKKKVKSKKTLYKIITMNKLTKILR